MSAGEHSFGGRHMDRYLIEFETDVAGDEGGGYDVAEVALAETLAGPEPTYEPADTGDDYADVVASLEAAAELSQELDPEVEALLAEWEGEEPADLPDGVTAEELQASIAFTRELAASLGQVEAEQRHAQLAERIETVLDPFSPDYDPGAAQRLASLILNGGEIEQHGAAESEAAELAETAARIDALTAAVAPDLPPSVVQEKADSIFDEVAELTGLSGDELVSTALQTAAELIRATGGARLAASELERFGAEEALRVDMRIDAAAETADRLYAEMAPGADRAAVQQRAGELLEPLREKTGLSGAALAREALRLAVEDVAETDDYDQAQARMTRRVQAGLPPLLSGYGRVADAVAVAERPVFDSYDAVEAHHKALAKGAR